ncbi:MAG TPA: hypothetical protein VFR47_17705 [Anaerolineales bacterium]|nr:hypothetical protein [Anaerolineales bacterium]
MPLPLILAGPILRRVEPRLVTVWLALRKSAQVTLSLWNNIANGGTGPGLFSGPPPDFTMLPASTLRVSENLHIALVMLELSQPDLLLPAHIYSYNLTFVTADGTHDLKSEGLLRDNIFDGHLHAALGYGNGDLPSFAMPPPELTELRLLQLSCRRPHEHGPDAVSFLDKLIEDKVREASERPHLVFMTGDQIYADDVAMSLLPHLTSVGQQLMGTIREKIPGVDGPFEVTQEKFPAGFRRPFFSLTAGFTTSDADSHLTSFGEYAAMYLMGWNNVLWPTPEADGSFSSGKFSRFKDLIARIEPAPDELISTWKELFRQPESSSLGESDLNLFLTHIFITLPRETLLKFLDKDDKFDPKTLEKKRLPLVDGDEFNTYQLTYNFARSLNEEMREKFRVFVIWLQGQFLGKQEESETQLTAVKELYDTLPQARRALANVPIYMMWDDHDVTDDWYITRAWRDLVLTKDAGVTTIRNGMVAAGLFQLWGNDPKAFIAQPGNPDHPNSRRAQFLSEVTNLFPAGASDTSQSAVNALNTLLGLDGADPPPLKWHFALDGPRFRVFVLDTRTRRTFLGRFTPPGMLSDGAIEDQIPEGPLPAGLEVLIVVSPVPVLGPPVDEEIARPLGIRFLDLKAAMENQPLHGQLKMDMEWWSANPFTFEKLLARLEPYKKVVFLSGDVHHGLGAQLSYWKKGEAQPACFIQFTSSPAKNILPAEEVVPIAGAFGVVQRILRLGIPVARMAWEEPQPSPLDIPGGQLASPRLRALLRRKPVLIPIHPWPTGTTANRNPDWSWKLTVLSDDRADSERPAPVRQKALPAGFDALPRLEQYHVLLDRHVDFVKKNLFGRVFVFTDNLGLVRFASTPAGLEARQELFSIHPAQVPSGKPLVYTVHKSLLEPTSEPPPALG